MNSCSVNVFSFLSVQSYLLTVGSVSISNPAVKVFVVVSCNSARFPAAFFLKVKLVISHTDTDETCLSHRAELML